MQHEGVGGFLDIHGRGPFGGVHLGFVAGVVTVGEGAIHFLVQLVEGIPGIVAFDQSHVWFSLC